MNMNRAKKLAALKGLPSHSRSLSAEEGAAIIDAYRRGVSIVAVAKALGVSRAGVYPRLGSWALNFCKCSGRKRGA